MKLLLGIILGVLGFALLVHFVAARKPDAIAAWEAALEIQSDPRPWTFAEQVTRSRA